MEGQFRRAHERCELIVLDVREREGWHVLAVAGELDAATAPRVRNEVVRLVADGVTRLVIDMSGVDFIDSFGLGALVGALKRIRSHQGRLVLVVSEPRVRAIFELTGLDKVFELTGSLDHLAGAGEA